MDTQQLKQLAGRVRALLEEASITVGHSQALDLSASLIGLRSWPEVQAFPERVRTHDLDLAAASRLAYRLEHKHGYRATSSALLERLLPPARSAYAIAPQIWPTGPAPGVYLTCSQHAVDAHIAQYEEATDGAVFYAERAGNCSNAAIDLGEYGLWSNGLERVPSGTLLVLGPIELDQQSWDDAAEWLQTACRRAADSGHRVVVLFDTPAPEQLAADVTLMIVEGDDGDLHEQIVGSVSDDGSLCPGVDRRYRTPAVQPRMASTAVLTDDLVERLGAALCDRSTGLIALGSYTASDNLGSEIAEAAIALTDHLGPAARILPRHRSTMSKFDEVPTAIRQLPFLPSVESAYAQGYRRFLIDPRYIKPETVSRFVDDALFIASTCAGTVDELAIWTVTNYGRDDSMMRYLIAAIAATPVPVDGRVELLTDLYIGDPTIPIPEGEKAYGFVADHRTLQVEDQFAALMSSGRIDMEKARDAGASPRTIARLERMLRSLSSSTA